jgi:hypothetical protein
MTGRQLLTAQSPRCHSLEGTIRFHLQGYYSMLPARPGSTSVRAVDLVNTMSLSTSIPPLSNTPPYLACHSLLPVCPEAEFLEEIQIKILRVYLLAIHSHFYRSRIHGRNLKSFPPCYSQSPLQRPNSWTKSRQKS